MLKNRLGAQGGKGFNKFTIPFQFNTFNDISYRISNFCEITPIVNNYLLSLLKPNNKTTLPKTGLWFFHIITSRFITNRQNYFPLIELGVRNDAF